MTTTAPTNKNSAELITKLTAYKGAYTASNKSDFDSQCDTFIRTITGMTDKQLAEVMQLEGTRTDFFKPEFFAPAKIDQIYGAYSPDTTGIDINRPDWASQENVQGIIDHPVDSIMKLGKKALTFVSAHPFGVGGAALAWYGKTSMETGHPIVGLAMMVGGLMLLNSAMTETAHGKSKGGFHRTPAESASIDTSRYDDPYKDLQITDPKQLNAAASKVGAHLRTVG